MAGSCLRPSPPKPGLGSYLKSQPQIQPLLLISTFNLILEQRQKRSDEQRSKENKGVKVRDSAQHVHLQPRRRLVVYESPRQVQVSPPSGCGYEDTPTGRPGIQRLAPPRRQAREAFDLWSSGTH